MGIKGLWSKVLRDTANGAGDFNENVPKGSTIHVDAMGFVFHVCETSIVSRGKQVSVPQIERQFGGSYADLKRLLDNEISRLTIDFGFKLLFYFDGGTSYYKGNTTLERRRQLEEKWAKMFEICLGDCNIAQADLPLPPLCVQALMSLIGKYNLQVVNCPYEADQELALGCARGNEAGTCKHYCYSSDSDMLLMKDCSVIKFGAFNDGRYATVTSEENVLEVIVPVYSLAKLAKFYHLTSNQFVTMCMLRGNDFTKNLEGFGVQKNFDQLYRQVKLGDPNYKLSSNDVFAEAAVRYSYAVYELQDLQPFHKDEYKTVNQLDELGGGPLLENGVLLTRTYKDNLHGWLRDKLAQRNNGQAQQTGTSKQSSKQDKVVYLTKVFDLVFQFIEEECISNKHCEEIDGLTNIILEHHVPALKEMTKHLNAGRLPPGKQKIGVEWENVKAGNFYQLLVKEVHKFFTKGGQNDLLDPMYAYDGHWFHKLAADHKRLAQKKKDKQPIETAMSGLTVAGTTVNHSASSLLKGLLKGNAAAGTGSSTGIVVHDSSVSLTGGVIGGVHGKVEGDGSASDGSSKVSSLDKLRKLLQSNKSSNGSPTPSPAFVPTHVLSKLNSKPRSVQANPQDVRVSRQDARSQNRKQDMSAQQNKGLPVDAFRDIILNKIRGERVIIIHGETGCGKSSRIPVFLYEDCQAKHKPCKIMISQPRRLAVVNLKNRLQEQLGSKVGMRMGHGVRDESDDTQLFFVTSGYLVQLLAHNKNACKSLTHIIIDEVHERSVDSDLLCFLVRKLLLEYPHLRVVLMSATLHTQLYRDYFGFEDQRFGDLECMSVGARRFPVDIFYPEDFAKAGRGAIKPLGGTGNKLAERIAAATKATKPVDHDPTKSYLPNITNQLMKDQYELCVMLVRTQAELGTGVLIFVAGLDDIIEIQAKFDGMNKYKVIPIHSQIPFEEQEQALVPAEPHEIKVIVATNAAESSITLPDCDMVICLGMHKEVNFLPSNMLRSVLKKDFISKSSATQRAGRTGRVRPGKCFRLYSQKTFEHMHDFPTSEMHRMPLHEVILNLQAIFESSAEYEGVSNILLSLLEPPAVESIKSSQNFLYSEHMITAPNDKGVLTSMGSFAGRMPVDLLSSKLIIYGICLGIGVESIIIASAIAQPKTLFRIMHPLIHNDPDEYNGIVRQTFFGSLHFDQYTYSDVICMLNIFIAWHNLKEHRDRFNLCTEHGLVMARLKHFYSNATHILSRVKSISTVTCDLSFDDLSAKLSKVRVNRIRLVMCWVYHTNLMMANEGEEKSARKKNKSQRNGLNFLIEESNDKIEIGKLDKNSLVLSTDCLDKMFPSDQHVHYSAAMLAKRTYMYRGTSKQSIIYTNYSGMETCMYRSFLYGVDGCGILLMSLVMQMTHTVMQATGKKNKSQPVQQTVDMSADCILGFSIQNPEDPTKDRYLSYVYSIVPSQYVKVDILELSRDDSGTAKTYMLCVVKVFNVFPEVIERLQLVVEGLGNTRLPYVIAHVCMSYQPNPHALGPPHVHSLYSPYAPPPPLPPAASLAHTSLLVGAEVRVVVDHFDPPSSLFAALNATTNVLQLSNTQALRQEILLYDSDSDEGEEDGKADVEEEKKKKKKVRSLDNLGVVKKKDRLFDDLSVGKRLFNSYCNGYKDRKMKLRDSCFTNVEGKDASKKKSIEPVVGSKEYVERKQKEADGEGGSAVAVAGGDTYRVVTLDCKPKIMGWTVLNLDEDDVHVDSDGEGYGGADDGADDAFGDDNKWTNSGNYDGEGEVVCISHLPWVRGFVTSRSVISTAYYSSVGIGEAGRLMGVAHNTQSMLNVVSGRVSIACEGVTLFPPGSLWISRALCCVGRGLAEGDGVARLVRGDAGAGKGGKGGNKSNWGGAGEDPMALCEGIRILLAGLKEGFICPNSLLMDKVNVLFLEFEE